MVTKLPYLRGGDTNGRQEKDKEETQVEEGS